MKSERTWHRKLSIDTFESFADPTIHERGKLDRRSRDYILGIYYYRYIHSPQAQIDASNMMMKDVARNSDMRSGYMDAPSIYET